MIRAGVGLSTLDGTIEAALEAVAAAKSPLQDDIPDWCVVFASGEHALAGNELLETIGAASGTPYVVGCSASGVFARGREIEDRSAIGVLAVASDSVRATPFLFTDPGPDQGMTAGMHIGKRFTGSRGSSDLIAVWPDPFHVRPDRLLEGIDAALPGVPVVGGAAASHRAELPTRQFCGTVVAEGAVAGVRLGGGFRHRIVVTQGYRPLGGPQRVTRSHENLILEVEGRPTLEVLRDHAPDDLMDDPARLMERFAVALVPDPAGFRQDSIEYLVRNIVAADPDTGLLAIAASVEEGEYVAFAIRDPQSAKEGLARALAPVIAEHEALRFRCGLYFDCMARGRTLYGKPDVDAEMLARALPGVPLLGMFCSAEMAPLAGANRFLTYSGVLVLLSD